MDSQDITLRELPVHNKKLALRFFLIENLGSTSGKDHRLQLRQTLNDLLVKEGHAPADDFSNLQKQMTHPDLSLSVSHGLKRSVVAWIAKPHKVGVDTEDLQRLNEGVIQRIATDEEILKSPEPTYLWSAKEAAFKCLSPAYKVVGSVEILNWTLVSPRHWTFTVQAKNASTGYGELCIIPGHSLAFFTNTP